MKKMCLTIAKSSGTVGASKAIGAAPASEVSKIGAERGFSISGVLARAAGIPRGPGRTLWHVDTARASFYARNPKRLKL